MELDLSASQLESEAYGADIEVSDANTNKRIIAFDLMESIAILMACSLHYPLFPIGSFPSEIWQLLCMGAVPTFFMINGYLLFSKPYSPKRHLKRVLNVVKGILFWKTLIFLIFLPMKTFDVVSVTPAAIVNYFLTADTLGNLPAAHIWFMYALLSIYILFPLFKFAYDCGKSNPIVFLIAMGIVLIPFGKDIDWIIVAIGGNAASNAGAAINVSGPIASLFPFGPWGMYLVFFLMGPFIWPRIDRLARSMGSFKFALASLVCLSISLLIALMQDFVYHGSFCWAGEVIPDQYKHMATIGVAISLLSLSRAIPLSGMAERVVSFFSRNTITIYYAHMPILFFLTIEYSWPLGFTLSIVRTVTVVVVGAVLGFVLKRIPIIRAIS